MFCNSIEAHQSFHPSLDLFFLDFKQVAKFFREDPYFIIMLSECERTSKIIEASKPLCEIFKNRFKFSQFFKETDLNLQ